MPAHFVSVAQALHFSYLIEAHDISVPSVTGRIFSGLMRTEKIWQKSSHPSGINFSGMSPLEIRAQCAMIRAWVKDHLPSLEADVICARYQRRGSVGKDGSYRFVFSRDRYDALLRLADHFASFYPEMNTVGIDLVVARAADGNMRAPSLRWLAENFGSSKDTWSRVKANISREMDIIELRAADMLYADFCERGMLVAPEEAEAQCCS